MSAFEITTIFTKRLKLVPISFAHSEGMYSLWCHPKVIKFSGKVTDFEGVEIPMPAASQSESDRIIDFWVKAAQEGWGFRWSLIQRSDNNFLGTIGFNSLENEFEIAFHLIPVYWNKGFMTEASRAAVDWAKSVGATSISAYIESGNKSSIALAKRLGMIITNETSGQAVKYKRNLGDI